jgi:hypothetical protein
VCKRDKKNTQFLHYVEIQQTKLKKNVTTSVGKHELLFGHESSEPTLIDGHDQNLSFNNDNMEFQPSMWPLQMILGVVTHLSYNGSTTDVVRHDGCCGNTKQVYQRHSLILEAWVAHRWWLSL